MIKYIFNTIITHQNDENKPLWYFNDISRYEQSTTSAIAAGETYDQGQRFHVLVYVVAPSERRNIAFPNLD